MTSKKRAVGTHLLCSVMIGLLAGFIVLAVWYPYPFFRIAGVSTILALLLGVDVILGPVLTALVYRAGKRLLWMDMGVIILVQLLAFAYGLYSIYAARPAWIVFSGYRFDLVQANELDERFLRDASRIYRKPSLFGPQWVAARMPTDVQKRNQLIFESLGGKSDMPQRPDLYLPLEQESVRLRAKATPLDKLEEIYGSESVREIKRRWLGADGYFPLVARSGHGHYVVIVDSIRAQVLGVAELKL